MRMKWTVPALIALLSACRSEPAPTTTAISHDAMVAALNGNYLWNCTLRNEAGTAQWRFVLEQRLAGRWPEIFLIEAGRDRAERVLAKPRGAAWIYTLRDGSDILIASDGEARGEGQNTTKGNTYPTGECQKGTA